MNALKRAWLWLRWIFANRDEAGMLPPNKTLEQALRDEHQELDLIDEEFHEQHSKRRDK